MKMERDFLLYNKTNFVLYKDNFVHYKISLNTVKLETAAKEQ